MPMLSPVYDSTKHVWRFALATAFQRGPAPVEVLLPDSYRPSSAWRTLYVLPVEVGFGGTFGDGLALIRQLDLHNRYGLICVAPAFDTLPWYGAHVSDPTIRHESFLLEILVPVIESLYSVIPGSTGRLLLGFSKSGWGAFTLLLRNPAIFGYAVSWDAPLMLEVRHFGYYGTAGHFGAPENFARYLPSFLFRSQARHFQVHPRFVLLGSSTFGPEPQDCFRESPHTVAAHELMAQLEISHDYSNSLPAPHAWHSDWLAPAVDRLLALAQAGPTLERSRSP